MSASSFFHGIWDAVVGFFNATTGIIDLADKTLTDGEKFVADTKAAIDEFKAFTFDPKWKTRVILVPTAIDKTKELILSVVNSIHDDYFALISNLKAALKSGQQLKDVQKGGTQAVIGGLTDVKNFVNEIDQGILALDNFVQAITAITKELETFDSIFLPQTNKRLTVDEHYAKRQRVGG